jgi:hypothetical protein
MQGGRHFAFPGRIERQATEDLKRPDALRKFEHGSDQPGRLAGGLANDDAVARA